MPDPQYWTFESIEENAVIPDMALLIGNIPTRPQLAFLGAVKKTHEPGDQTIKDNAHNVWISKHRNDKTQTTKGWVYSTKRKGLKTPRPRSNRKDGPKCPSYHKTRGSLVSQQHNTENKKKKAGLGYGVLANVRWFLGEQRKILSFDEGVFIFMLSAGLIFNALLPMLWVFAVSQTFYGLYRACQRGYQLHHNQHRKILTTTKK